MKVRKLLAGLLAAVLTVSSVPAASVAAAAPEVKATEEVDLKLRYTSPAGISSYSDWEKWSLPIGNSGIGASVFGGVT